MSKSKKQLDGVIVARMGASAGFRRSVLNMGILAIVAFICAPALLGASLNPASVGCAVAVGLFSMPVRILMDEETDTGGGGGGAALSEAEFQGKVLESAKKSREQLESLTKNYENLEKSTKAEFEALTKLKNGWEGMDSEVKAMQLAMKRVELAIGRERKAAFGDPIQRIQACEQKRTMINALIRQAAAFKNPNVKLNEAQQKALTSGASPGSTLIDDELMTDVYDLLSMYGIWNTFDVRQVSTISNKFLVKTARPVASYFGEGVAITEDTAKAGTSVTQTTGNIKVLLGVANELLQDSEIDLSGDILRDFAEAVAYRMDWSCLQADGTADGTDGGMTGIFGGGGTAKVSASGNVTMETQDFEDVTGVLLASPDAVIARSPKWWMHPYILIRFLHIKDLNGRPIFLTATEAPSPGGIGSILGAPVVLSSAAPTANAANAKFAVYGDPNAMAVGLRKGFEFAASNEANFAEYETMFRGVARFGNKVRAATGFTVMTAAGS